MSPSTAAHRSLLGGDVRPGPGVRVRPLAADDVPAAIALTWEAFGIPADSPALLGTWTARMHMMLRTDPAGVFAAVDAREEVIGVSAALARGRLWVLSLLAVRPGIRAAGPGAPSCKPRWTTARISPTA